METIVVISLTILSLTNLLLCAVLIAVIKTCIHTGTTAQKVALDEVNTASQSVGGIEHDCLTVAHSFDLSERESDVFVLIVRGKSYSAIAENLGISTATVKCHVSRIYRKMGVHSRDCAITLFEETLHRSPQQTDMKAAA